MEKVQSSTFISIITAASRWLPREGSRKRRLYSKHSVAAKEKTGLPCTISCFFCFFFFFFLLLFYFYLPFPAICLLCLVQHRFSLSVSHQPEIQITSPLVLIFLLADSRSNRIRGFVVYPYIRSLSYSDAQAR